MKKRILSFAGLLLTAVLTLSLSSCDKDYEEATYLNGIWAGSVSSETFYYSHYWDEAWTESDDWYVQFKFEQTGTYSGRGQELDYNMYDGSRNSASFYWTVDRGNIYLDYTDGSHLTIWNYRLSKGYFAGDIHDSRTGDYVASFSLEKIASWRDYNWYDNWYYSKEQKQVVEGEE